MKRQYAPVSQTVTVTDHLWIPMPDGIRLAARLWLPDSARTAPVPAIFEYIPYRKADMVRARDERNHPFFAANGFACLRVDMRGSGDSEGHMPDMYADPELTDARHVIDWIAAQPWCDGNVGMFGTSWGGTASLQANVDAPKALKAIIAVCATHDRYEDDIHHMGGCLLTDTFEWGATLPAILAAPPTPNAGPEWQSLWRDRLVQLTNPVEAWVREEARGTYWRHGSVIHQAKDLSRPILAIGGWADRYSNSVMSLARARPDLVWGVVGPWGHHYPDHGHPGPGIGFQELALDWWNRWLRPDAAAADWPRLRLWLRQFEWPADAIDDRAGLWMEADPTGEDTQDHLLDLGDAFASGSEDRAPAPWTVPLDLSVGSAAGDTGYFGRFGGLPLDQGEEDAKSLTFETAPLDADLVLCGSARFLVDMAGGRQDGQLIVRLTDVSPEGVSSLVCRTVRNLALDDHLDAPSSDTRDRNQNPITLVFPTMAYRFQKGHRLRLSVSSSYWPMIWPSPESQPLELGGCHLHLPVLRNAPTVPAFDFPPAADLPITKSHEILSDPLIERFASQDLEGLTESGWAQPFTEVMYKEIDTAFGYETRAEYSISAKNSLSARATFAHTARYRRPEGVAEIRSTLTASADRDRFHIRTRVVVEWNDHGMLDRTWTSEIPRVFS